MLKKFFRESPPSTTSTVGGGGDSAAPHRRSVLGFIFPSVAMKPSSGNTLDGRGNNTREATTATTNAGSSFLMSNSASSQVFAPSAAEQALFSKLATIAVAPGEKSEKVQKKIAVYNEEKTLPTIMQSLKRLKRGDDPAVGFLIFDLLRDMAGLGNEDLKKKMVRSKDLIHSAVEYLSRWGGDGKTTGEVLTMGIIWMASLSENYAKELELLSLTQVDTIIKVHFKAMQLSSNLELQSAALALAVNLRIYHRAVQLSIKCASDSDVGEEEGSGSTLAAHDSSASSVNHSAHKLFKLKFGVEKLTVAIELFGPLVSCKYCDVTNAEKIELMKLDADHTFRISHFFFAIKKRPNLDEFLLWCSQRFHLVVYSSKGEAMVKEVLSFIDPAKKFFMKKTLSRADCVESRGNFVKNLKALEVISTHPNRIVVIDSNVARCVNLPDNFIPITKFEVEQISSDDALLSLKKFIKKIENLKDVREVLILTFHIRKFINQDEISNNS